jgi:glycogen synthase
MRVLMTTDAVGGVWQYATQLASLLAARGARVRLASMGPEPSAGQLAEVARVPGVDIRVGRYALEWMPGAWPDVDAASSWLLDLERDFAPDVVHLNGFCHAALPWRAPVLVVSHSCVYSWWEAVHHTEPPAEWDEYRRRVAAGLAAADAVVAPSRAMRDAAVRLYGARDDIMVIPNGRTADGVAATEKEALIFAAGRIWDPAKNIAALDVVAPEIAWPIVVAGDAEAAGVNSTPVRHVRCLGRVTSDAVLEWMRRAAIYAFPARYEPFGLSVLEAASSGCALVLGDIASLRENWDGVARFVHPGSPDALRDALRALIERADERQALGDAARRRAADFSAARQVSAYVDLYQRMVAAHDRTPDSSRAH